MLIVFVHGYSVSSFDTYGGLPARILGEAAGRGLEVNTEHIYLARYISFNDQVRIDDLAAALQAALTDTIYSRYPKQRFACITHSTGGPLVRTWLSRFYPAGENCPLSHLIMLAPANHGSALAQLGKSRVSRIKSWFNGLEPGQRVLDWLELGSRGSWTLNTQQLQQQEQVSANGVYFFVLTGQDIDRKFYDHINAYTGEPGSDGVVRVASANLNDTWVRLVQEKNDHRRLSIKNRQTGDRVPLRILARKSHSNEDMGVMRSVLANGEDINNADTVDAIFECLKVKDSDTYQGVRHTFAVQTDQVQKASMLEKENKLTGTRYYIHDRYCMVIFRIRDSEGHFLRDFDLLLTSGPGNSADELPPGFFKDRQCNCRDKSTLTYYLNYDIMNGCEEVADNGRIVRPAQPGMRSLGITVIPRPDKGLVRYASTSLSATPENFAMLLKPNATTLVEIVLQRLLSTEVLRLERLGEAGGDWKDKDPGELVI